MKNFVPNMVAFCLVLLVQPMLAQSSHPAHSIEKNPDHYFLSITVSLFSILLLIIGPLFFRNLRKLRLERDLACKLLLLQEKDRERISNALHNTIGQNVLFIRNQMVKNNQTELIQNVDDTIEGIRAISRDLYPAQLEKYGLGAAVEAMAEKSRERSSVFISHDLEALESCLSADQKINFYRIIQECMTNTLQHAEASAMRISAQKTAKGIELVIQDNGKGFDKSIFAKNGQHSGLMNIETRTRFLKGRLDIQTSPGNGTKLTFYFPA